MSHVLESAGAMPLAEMTRAHILDGRERRKATPSQANNFLNTMRSLFKWAKESELVAADPTQDVKIVPRPKTGGFRVWTEDEIERFEAHWPIGTRERLALDLLLYTGLRRGDVVRLGRPHVKDGQIPHQDRKGRRPDYRANLAALGSFDRGGEDGRFDLHHRRAWAPDGQRGIRDMVQARLQ